MRAWAKEKFFTPAGITSAIFETDRSGTLIFSSSCFMTTRDMARFGQLYLDDGMSGTTRVLASSWVKYTSTPAPPVTQPKARVAGIPPGDSGGSYGGAFWLNAATPTASPDTFLYPQAPADTYAAEGHWGQKIFIIPSRRLVVARVGNDRAPIFDPGPMLGAAVAAVDAADAAAAKGVSR
jgi:CubicO group peptidase (beta-lactamase class C family)